MHAINVEAFVLLSLKAELPPPYTAIASPDAGGVPVINCRVCQSLINLDGKMHQHVVKCTVCNEATVGEVCHTQSGHVQLRVTGEIF